MKRGRNPKCPVCKQPLYYHTGGSRRGQKDFLIKVLLVCFGISLFICLGLCIFDAFPIF